MDEKSQDSRIHNRQQGTKSIDEFGSQSCEVKARTSLTLPQAHDPSSAFTNQFLNKYVCRLSQLYIRH